ncbi:hypothetical protein M0R88_16135 [Halorussus gelatinilyticus]|uniref:DUF7344 domain-containing protein n=1 Tax=Halorussus gelatinilyticus TaxID=2937524 RepID=A0A8U0IH75_9EURY|nr:hypothetical protein [Halorussus gelatinilyticus]UPW00031.1 hypothetical protein M0R88_16135 [Halorussus gelatinilyticus]
MPDDRSDGGATPPSEEGPNTSGTPRVPTADLRTGEESSEKLDAAFALLADPLRRDALVRLAESDETVLSLDSLAAAVASKRWDAAGDRTFEDVTEARSLAVELHHAHLPKLESHGVVRYDPTERSVEYLGREWLDEWLDHVRQAEVR